MTGCASRFTPLVGGEPIDQPFWIVAVDPNPYRSEGRFGLACAEGNDAGKCGLPVEKKVQSVTLLKP